MKRFFRYCFALAAAISANVGTAAESPHIAREAIEWCNVWIPDANETKLPRVLLIGDSITGGYGPKVEEALKGKASVARLTTSKSIGDPVLLMEVALVLGQCRFDVVHFNNGLHGWGYSEEEYQQHFPELVATIRKNAAQAKLIWATTTPVRQAGNLNVIAEDTKRVESRNKIADGIVAREKIAVNDLFGLVKDHPGWRTMETGQDQGPAAGREDRPAGHADVPAGRRVPGEEAGPSGLQLPARRGVACCGCGLPAMGLVLRSAGRSIASCCV